VHLQTHLDDVTGGEGLLGYVVLIESHVNAGGQNENGQVHFDGFAQGHLAAAVATGIDPTVHGEMGVVALHPSRRFRFRLPQSSKTTAVALAIYIVMISFVLAASLYVGFLISFVRFRILYYLALAFYFFVKSAVSLPLRF